MFIEYDLQYEVVKNGQICIQIDKGCVNVDKIQSLEITATSLYIYLSEAYHIKFEHDPVVLYNAFTDLLKESGTVPKINVKAGTLKLI